MLCLHDAYRLMAKQAAGLAFTKLLPIFLLELYTEVTLPKSVKLFLPKLKKQFHFYLTPCCCMKRDFGRAVSSVWSSSRNLGRSLVNANPGCLLGIGCRRRRYNCCNGSHRFLSDREHYFLRMLNMINLLIKRTNDYIFISIKLNN